MFGGIDVDRHRLESGALISAFSSPGMIIDDLITTCLNDNVRCYSVERFPVQARRKAHILPLQQLKHYLVGECGMLQDVLMRESICYVAILVLPIPMKLGELFPTLSLESVVNNVSRNET